MILGMSVATFTLVHTLISLVAIDATRPPGETYTASGSRSRAALKAVKEFRTAN